MTRRAGFSLRDTKWSRLNILLRREVLFVLISSRKIIIIPGTTLHVVDFIQKYFLLMLFLHTRIGSGWDAAASRARFEAVRISDRRKNYNKFAFWNWSVLVTYVRTTLTLTPQRLFVFFLVEQNILLHCGDAIWQASLCNLTLPVVALLEKMLLIFNLADWK